MHRGFAAALVLAMSGTFFTSVAQAGVTYSPTTIRRITARAGNGGVSHTETAPDLGTFDADVSADASTADFRSFARVTQHSVLGPDGFTLSGRREFETAVLNPGVPPPRDASAETLLDDVIAFTLNRASKFDFKLNTAVEERSGNGDGDSTLLLAHGNGGAFLMLNTPEDGGTLPAGDYRMAYDSLVTNSLAGNPDPAKHVFTYDLSMHFTPLTGNSGGGGGGGGPTPVPLPPAAWTGLATFVLAGFAWLRHRRAVPGVR